MNARRISSIAGTLLLAASLQAGTATITIDARRKGPAINPRMYGIFLEEINHGVDGGLYAELIRNRGFEDSRPPEGFAYRDGRWLDAKGYDAGFSQFGYTTESIPFWSLVEEGDVKGTMSLETTGGITEQSCHCLRLDVEDAAGGRLGVANTGFFGIGLRQGQKYNLSLYVRGAGVFKGPLSVRLEDSDGKPLSDAAEIQGIDAVWKQFKATLTASATESKARLVILAGAEGTVWLDFVSLFPETTWKGRPNGLRPDIAQMIADLKPGFVRFPGGCVVEGGTVETAYNWKRTVGPVETRQECWGPWNYRFTHGMGLHEYFQFCEDLGAEPLWVGFCGQTCIFRQMENVPMEEMGWVRDNFLDVVEYANGPTDSKWGSLRAQAGRPRPFNLKYVEIGNENAEKAYEERYRFIYDAMKAKYPDLVYLPTIPTIACRPSSIKSPIATTTTIPPGSSTASTNTTIATAARPPLPGRGGRDQPGRRPHPRQPPGRAGRGGVSHGLRAQRRRGADGVLRPFAGPRRRANLGLARHDLPRRHTGLRHGLLLSVETLRPEPSELHGGH
jgi:hypothetical protein